MIYTYDFTVRGSLKKIEVPENLDNGTSSDSSKADGVPLLIAGPGFKEKSDLSEMIWKQTRKSLSVMVTFCPITSKMHFYKSFQKSNNLP